MKSKELIKQLQEADPTGEVEVYGCAGAIHFIELMPGYWDGTCEYFEQSKFFPEKMFVTDKLDQKILIREINLEEFIFTVGGDLSRVILNVRDPERWEKKCEEYTKEVKKIIKELNDAQFKDFMQKFIIEKFEIICPDKTKADKFHEQYWRKDGKLDKLCQGDCVIVLKSGFFKQIEDSNYIKYVLK